MNLADQLNIWGGGQLLAFSGFDGDTDGELLIRSVAGLAAFEVKLPQAGGVVIADLAPPAACFLAGDHFELELCSGEKVRGAFLDACHLLILGRVSVAGLSDALRMKRGPDLSPYHQAFSDYGWNATLYVDMLFSKTPNRLTS